MKTAIVPALILAALALSAPASASDWVMLGGTEEGRKDALVPWGFAQLLVESTPWSAPVVDLQAPGLAPYNGHHLAAELTEPFDLSVRRARLGVRGSVPGTGQRLVVFAAVDAGENALTRDRGLVLVDASVTWSALPGLRLRAGQFKLPTADEAIENNPTASSFTRFSPFVSGLLIEQDVEGGAITGPAAALRDVGVQAFDAIPVLEREGARLELGYALMASLGRPAHTFDRVEAVGLQLAQVAAAGPEVTGRVQLAWIFDEATRHRAFRDELGAWAFRQQGHRLLAGSGDVDDVLASRVRQGVGAHLQLQGVRVRGEAVFADGAVLAPGAFAGQPAAIVADGRAWGGSVDVSLARLGSLDLDPFVADVTFDWLHRNPDDPVASRLLQAVTVGTQVKLSRTFRLLLNAELRRQLVGDKAPADAALVAAGLSPLLSAQLNLVF